MLYENVQQCWKHGLDALLYMRFLIFVRTYPGLAIQSVLFCVLYLKVSLYRAYYKYHFPLHLNTDEIELDYLV